MAQSLFESKLGFSDESTSILSGVGAPGGDASFQDNAPVGSIYKRTSNGDLYIKDTAGTGADKWEPIATQTFATNIGAASSWREIVLVRDNNLYTNIAAAEAAANVGDTVDGITITSGDRILFDNLTAGNENVYIVSGSTGAWTFTNDSNAETAGDRVSVISGTDAGRVYAYDGTAWFFSNQSATQEEGFLRTFMGKSAAGSETPTYSSTNVVTTGNSLESEIGALDLEIGAAVLTPQTRTAGPIADQAINLNVEALDDAIGANVTSTNHASAANSANANISLLDAEMGPAVTNGTVILAAAKMNANIQALDTEIADRLGLISSNGITTATVVDNVLVDSKRAVKWAITATKVANEADVYASEILAIHNGTSSLDATSVDSNEYGIVNLGAAIAGLTISITLTGTGAAQAMNLSVSSTDSVNITVARIKL